MARVLGSRSPKSSHGSPTMVARYLSIRPSSSWPRSGASLSVPSASARRRAEISPSSDSTDISPEHRSPTPRTTRADEPSPSVTRSKPGNKRGSNGPGRRRQQAGCQTEKPKSHQNFFKSGPFSGHEKIRKTFRPDSKLSKGITMTYKVLVLSPQVQTSLVYTDKWRNRTRAFKSSGSFSVFVFLCREWANECLSSPQWISPPSSCRSRATGRTRRWIVSAMIPSFSKELAELMAEMERFIAEQQHRVAELLQLSACPRHFSAVRSCLDAMIRSLTAETSLVLRQLPFSFEILLPLVHVAPKLVSAQKCPVVDFSSTYIVLDNCKS